MAKRRNRRPIQKNRPDPQQILSQAATLGQTAEQQFHRGEYEAALTTVDETVALLRPLPHAKIENIYFLRANCLQKLGRLEEARRAAEHELRVNPEHPRVQQFLAFLDTPAARAREITARFEDAVPPPAWPAVSLCMIVKNEADNLTDCLRSVGDFAAEMIIVDTGSTDNTVAIAESFGATVRHFDWVDDFAAARNESIRDAAGDWIFWMDADDRLSPENLNRLKQAAASDTADAYGCRVESVVGGRGSWGLQYTEHIRLFRSGQGIKFDGAVHENVSSSLQSAGLTTAQTNIVIQHTGYTAGEVVLQAKAKRNQVMIEQALGREPDNIYWYYQLAVGLYIQKEYHRAAQHFERSLDDPLHTLQKFRYQIYALLIAIYQTYLNQPQRARQLIILAREEYPQVRHLAILAGTSNLALGHIDQAIESLEYAATLPPDEKQVGLAWAPGTLELRLSQAYLLSNRLPAARKSFLQHLQLTHQPNQVDPQTLRERAIAAAMSQQWSNATQSMERAVILGGVLAGDWATLASYTEKAGALPVSRQYARLAAQDTNTDIPKYDGQDEGNKASTSITIKALQNEPDSWPSVSLCMIVKNEEEHLASCLESVRDFVSEMIIVDTGSTDRTVEIARRFGARVEYFEWIDDFAAARNKSLKYATGEWIFWMDADDRLDRENLNRLKHLAANGPAEAYACRVISQSGTVQDQLVTTTYHLRLFRRSLGLQFEGAVHENLDRAAKRIGVAIAQTNIEIEHTGYTVDPDKMLNKARRNAKILAKLIQVSPQDTRLHFYLGSNYVRLKKYDEALYHLKFVVQNSHPGSIYRIGAESALLGLYQVIDPTQVDPLLHRLLTQYPNYQFMWGLAGYAFLQQNNLNRAAETFEKAIDMQVDATLEGQSFPPGRLRQLLSLTYLLQGKLAKGQQVYRAMATEKQQTFVPLDPQIYQQAQALFATGRCKETIETLRHHAFGNAKALRLMTEAVLLSELPHKWLVAARYLQAAILSEGLQPGDWSKLAKLTFKSGQLFAAGVCCQHALEKNSVDGNALNLLGLIALKNEQPVEAVAYLVQAALIGGEYQNAALNNLSTLANSIGTSVADLLRQYALRQFQTQRVRLAAKVMMLLSAKFPDATIADDFKVLAVAYQQSGQEDAAITAWQQAQELQMKPG